MKKTAARLAVHALEQLGITHTFGIPGVHNTELYDEVAGSARITPLLVTHEGGGAFMADAFSPATLAAMRAIKQALDPDGILNPGKVLPPA